MQSTGSSAQSFPPACCDAGGLLCNSLEIVVFLFAWFIFFSALKMCKNLRSGFENAEMNGAEILHSY